MKIIIYGSLHGTTKQYAEELSRRTKIEAISYEDVSNINDYETIIYFGALYAGGVLGMKKVFNRLNSCDNKKLIIATVGLADPDSDENIQNIRNSIRPQLGNEIFEKSQIFNLRGGIDYKKLSVKHKVMMSLLVKKVKSIPEEKKNSEQKEMIATYNKIVDFVDFKSLDKIEAAL